MKLLLWYFLGNPEFYLWYELFRPIFWLGDAIIRHWIVFVIISLILIVYKCLAERRRICVFWCTCEASSIFVTGLQCTYSSRIWSFWQWSLFPPCPWFWWIQPVYLFCLLSCNCRCFFWNKLIIMTLKDFNNYEIGFTTDSPCCSWEAGQILGRKLMLSLVADFQQNKPLQLNAQFVDGLKSTLCNNSLDKVRTQKLCGIVLD